MHPRFVEITSILESRLELLLQCEPRVFGELPTSMPSSGVYPFSEGSSHLYVGRSNRLRERYFLHCRPGSRHNQASFAYKLAREKLGIARPSYAVGDLNRASLALSTDFVTAFAEAKARVRRTHYRFVGEPGQTRQALLEAYCVIALETPYNDFDTH